MSYIPKYLRKDSCGCASFAFERAAFVRCLCSRTCPALGLYSHRSSVHSRPAARPDCNTWRMPDNAGDVQYVVYLDIVLYCIVYLDCCPHECWAILKRSVPVRAEAQSIPDESSHESSHCAVFYAGHGCNGAPKNGKERLAICVMHTSFQLETRQTVNMQRGCLFCYYFFLRILVLHRVVCRWVGPRHCAGKELTRKGIF